MMNLTMRNEGGNAKLTMNGELTFADNESLHKIVKQMGSNGMRSLAVNMSGVTFVDSAGLGLLVLLKEAADREKVDMRLKGTQGQVRKMLDISQFQEVVPYD
jgi:anti-anti-sigma factor